MYAIFVGIVLILAAAAVALFGVLDALPYVIAAALLGLSSVVFNLDAMQHRQRRMMDALEQIRVVVTRPTSPRVPDKP